MERAVYRGCVSSVLSQEKQFLVSLCDFAHLPVPTIIAPPFCKISTLFSHLIFWVGAMLKKIYNIDYRYMF